MAQHRLIELVAESGQRSDAVRQFELFEELIRRELETQPLEETRKLVRRIREGTATVLTEASRFPRNYGDSSSRRLLPG